MDDLRVGALFRAARRRKGLRQVDVAAAAGVSQQTISRLERGALDRFGVQTVREIGAVLGIVLPFEPWVRDRDVVRLSDSRHLAIVEEAAGRLHELGWQTRLEFSFNHFGERGCLDILAYRVERRAIAIPEVKSAIPDVQELCRSIDVRDRVVPLVFEREFGWRPQHVASLVVLPSESTARRIVAEHGRVFDVALPARTLEVRRWLEEPSGRLRGIWFLPVTPDRRAIRNPGSPGRVRRRREGPDDGQSRSAERS